MSSKPDIRGSELERQIDLVTPGPGQVVDEDPVAWFDEDDAAPMHDGIGQRGVAVVLGVKKIEVGRRVPLAQADPRMPAPAEWARRLGLADAVHDNRAVRGRAAEVIPPFRVAAVAVRARVDDARLAED